MHKKGKEDGEDYDESIGSKELIMNARRKE